MALSTADCLGMGAILAYLTCEANRSAVKERFVDASGYLGTAVMAICWVIYSRIGRPALPTMHRDLVLCFFWSATALLFTWVVDRARVGFGGDLGALLNMKSLRYMGKISYGLYVYHYFAPALCLYLPDFIRKLLPEPWSWVVISFSMAILSWHLVERPLLRLKRYIYTKNQVMPFVYPENTSLSGPDNAPLAKVA